MKWHRKVTMFRTALLDLMSPLANQLHGDTKRTWSQQAQKAEEFKQTCVKLFYSTMHTSPGILLMSPACNEERGISAMKAREYRGALKLERLQIFNGNIRKLNVMLQ